MIFHWAFYIMDYLIHLMDEQKKDTGRIWNIDMLESDSKNYDCLKEVQVYNDIDDIMKEVKKDVTKHMNNIPASTKMTKKALNEQIEAGTNAVRNTIDVNMEKFGKCSFKFFDKLITIR